MKIDLSKPELICWMLITILFGISSENQTMEIQLHDRYFQITNVHLVITVSAMLFIHGLIYWSIHRENFIQKRNLIFAQIILSTLGLFTLVNFGNFKEPMVSLNIPTSILLLASILLGLLLMLTNFLSRLTKN